MRVAYLAVRDGDGHTETFGPQPRADAELDWEWAMSELSREGKTTRRVHLLREGDVLRRAEFDGPYGSGEVLLIDDGSW